MAFGLSSLLGLSSDASWRDGYIQASFRGVEFYVQTATKTGGRKIVVHEFPETDDSYNEDLGKKYNTFPVSAYVVGDEYFNQRNDLEEALDQSGPGILLHPYRGELSVVVDSYSTVETVDEGRMCRIDINFILDKEEALTVLGPGPYDLLSDAINSFQAAALSLMGDVYDIANAPNAILNDLNGIANSALTIVGGAKAVMQTDDLFLANLQNLQDNVSELITSPSLLFAEMQDLISFGTDVNDIANQSFVNGSVGKELFDNMGDVTAFQDTSYSKFPEITNVDGEPAREMQKFISRSGLTARAGLVSTMEIKNATEADGIMSDLDAIISTVETDELISDDLYQAAQDLRVALRSVIQARKLILSDLATINLVEFEPAIVLAYELYRDYTRDIEIAELNEVLHPGFIPGGDVIVEGE